MTPMAALALPVRPRQRALLLRLDTLLRELRTDPTLRRRLRCEAPAVFAERGFPTEAVPASLPAMRTTDVLLTHGQLFGLAPTAPLDAPGLELRLLAYGLKPVALVHGQDAELRASLAWAEARGYTALLSACEWQRGIDTGKGGYSNLATTPQRASGDAGAWRSLLVGADEAATALAWLALTLGWDELLGRLLGYPACCAKAFPRRWARAAASHQGDLAAVCIDDSGPGPHDWRVSSFGRYLGAELIQHFPCSYGCAASRRLAARADAALVDWEPELRAYTRGLLEAPALYAEADGVALLPGAEVEASEGTWRLRYDPACAVFTNPGGALHAALGSARVLQARPSEREIDVADRTLAARLVVFSEATAACLPASTTACVT